MVMSFIYPRVFSTRSLKRSSHSSVDMMNHKYRKTKLLSIRSASWRTNTEKATWSLFLPENVIMTMRFIYARVSLRRLFKRSSRSGADMMSVRRQ
ncbi:hypothetical protein CEXT_487951 [Caerostris extrusa]|uniref:Uncharacterized protein n=1 Tax=Caerostris extrusa TaxID=172846 RepID=A0AAV4X9K0_CAEEX|nr:hypothetical protein CEXT_487951 [Caerostris extrusa]